jgi:putative hemolysin
MILDDVLTTLNVKRVKALRYLVSFLGRKPTRWLADLLSRWDRQIERSSFVETARDALHLFTSGFELHSIEEIPQSGPLLAVANHPGMYDSIGAVVTVGREDVRVVAARREFFRVLPHISNHLLTIETDTSLRLEAVRHIIQSLKDGQAVIIFPSGKLEPEPSLMPGAVASLEQWSASVGVFLSKVPETRLLPILISQTLSPKAWNSWLARLPKTQKRRHKAAMGWQFLKQRVSKDPAWKMPLRIDTGRIKTASDLDPSLDPKKLSQAVRDEMKSLLNSIYPEYP